VNSTKHSVETSEQTVWFRRLLRHLHGQETDRAYSFNPETALGTKGKKGTCTCSTWRRRKHVIVPVYAYIFMHGNSVSVQFFLKFGATRDKSVSWKCKEKK